VICFGSVTRKAIKRSMFIKRRLKSAIDLVQKNLKETQDAQRKALIIQLIIQDKTDLAAEKYERHGNALPVEEKREISMYVHEKLDADLIPCVFPDLPPPYKNEEFQRRKQHRSVEAHIKSVKKAKRDLDREYNRLSSEES